MSSSIYLSLLYAAFASCFLLLMSYVVLKRLPRYLHFLQCSSPFLVYNIALSFLC